MQTPLNSQRPDKVKIYAIIGVILVITLFVSYYGQEIDAATPSEFLSHLASREFLSWHRWRPLSFDEAGWAFCLICLLIVGIFGYLLPKPPAGQARRGFRPIFFGSIAAFLLIFFVYAPVAGGFAIYADHLAVENPFRDLQVRRVNIVDIDHIEIGCHERIAGRHAPNWHVPSYRIVLHDGEVVSLLDLADSDYANNQLMRAVLTFDNQVQASGIPKRLRKNIFGATMGDRGNCYADMESDYSDDLRAGIRKAFEGG